MKIRHSSMNWDVLILQSKDYIHVEEKEFEN